MPNQLNNAEGIFYRDIIPFLPQTEFVKNASSDSVVIKGYLSAELVWRLSEFAFFVRLLR